LRQLYLALLVELAGLHEERHEHELAIELLRKVTSEESILEEAHAALMRLHAISGRPERALAEYDKLRDTLSTGLCLEPTAATRRLRDEIAAGRYLPTPSVGCVREEESPAVGMHNLSAPMTSFVGRAQEIVEVKRTLAMTRILTLAGAGGSGKTRLALEVAKDLIGAYPDGVWMVELTPSERGAGSPGGGRGSRGYRASGRTACRHARGFPERQGDAASPGQLRAPDRCRRAPRRGAPSLVCTPKNIGHES
jgi:hypothetical protein